jgi:hypothetical protein
MHITNHWRRACCGLGVRALASLDQEAEARCIERRTVARLPNPWTQVIRVQLVRALDGVARAWQELLRESCSPSRIQLTLTFPNSDGGNGARQDAGRNREGGMTTFEPEEVVHLGHLDLPVLGLHAAVDTLSSS